MNNSIMSAYSSVYSTAMMQGVKMPVYVAEVRTPATSRIVHLVRYLRGR